MIVKIGDKIYNSVYQPIMIILDDDEKTLIKDMGEQTKFCSYPQGWKPEKVKEFMGVSYDKQHFDIEKENKMVY